VEALLPHLQMSSSHPVLENGSVVRLVPANECAELIDTFVTDANLLMLKMNEALDSKMYDQMQIHLLALQGVCGNLGLKRLHQMCIDIQYHHVVNEKWRVVLKGLTDELEQGVDALNKLKDETNTILQ